MYILMNTLRGVNIFFISFPNCESFTNQWDRFLSFFISLVEFLLIKHTLLGPRYSIVSVDSVQYEVSQTEIVVVQVRGPHLGRRSHFESGTIISELSWRKVHQRFSTGRCQPPCSTSLSIIILQHKSQLQTGLSLVPGADLDQDVGDGPHGGGELTSYWSVKVVSPFSKTSIELIAVQPDLGMTGRFLKQEFATLLLKTFYLITSLKTILSMQSWSEEG